MTLKAILIILIIIAIGIFCGYKVSKSNISVWIKYLFYIWGLIVIFLSSLAIGLLFRKKE